MNTRGLAKEGVPYSISYSEFYQSNNSQSVSRGRESSRAYILTGSSPVSAVMCTQFISIPLNVLSGGSALENIVYHLKETCNLTFATIAKLINRDQRTIWNSYHNARRKKGLSALQQITAPSTNNLISIPMEIFFSRNLSVLESIVFYLKTQHDLSLQDIALAMRKNYRTIWTVYRRAKVKINNE